MEIHEEVIKTVCDEFGLGAHRADETYGPGLIIEDVTREISESQFVIAEITPPNPNVYYEIGFAHAIKKPVILLADKEKEKLPFDVSGFRTLFYQNSIAGKRKFEEGLRKNIAALLQKDPISG
jgi:nucleoside 2-deoxyribosyltransferase